MRRVVITGMGAITSGFKCRGILERFKRRQTAFGEITRFDSREYKAHLAAEVKGFQGKDYMDFKAAKRMELFCQYAVAAAKEAFLQSGLDGKGRCLSGGLFHWFRYRQPSDCGERA